MGGIMISVLSLVAKTHVTIQRASGGGVDFGAFVTVLEDLLSTTPVPTIPDPTEQPLLRSPRRPFEAFIPGLYDIKDGDRFRDLTRGDDYIIRVVSRNNSVDEAHEVEGFCRLLMEEEVLP
jgi:hypothetical protein